MSDPDVRSTAPFQGQVTFDLQTDLIKNLGSNENNFRILVDLLPICLMVLRGGVIIYSSPGLLRLLGYGKEDLFGQSPLSLFPFEDHPEIMKRSQNITGGENHYNPPIELKVIKKNGEKLFVEGESIAVIHQGVPAVMILLHDISLRKNAQESQDRTEKNFKTMIQQMPDGIIIDQPKEILFVNQSLIRMLGFENEWEFVGRSPFDFIASRFHSSIQKRIVNIYELGGHNSLLEYEWIKKDGSTLAVEGSSISIIYEGKEAVLAVVRDITERKAAQEAQRKADENFHTILNEMPDGVVVVDQGKVLFTNPSLVHMLGYGSPEELHGRPMFDYINSDDHSLVREMVDRAGHGEQNPAMLLKMIGKDGKPVEVESTSFSIQFNGKPAFIAVIRNLTLQKNIQGKMAVNNKLATMGVLTAGIIHEINNPLNIILSNMIFLAENYGDLKSQMNEKGFLDEKCSKLFKEIGEELSDTTQGGERIQDIVRGLKAFSRSGEGEVVEVDLNKTVESAIHMTSYEIKDRAGLIKDLAPGLPLLTLNPGKLQQVFVNLLINASQAFEEDKPSKNLITVRTGLRGEMLFVEISDTGKGITENNLQKIFEPFFTTKPIGVGTGLGLPICREILRRYQGTLEVQSQVGNGTTFTVNLPVKNRLKSKDPVVPS